MFQSASTTQRTEAESPDEKWAMVVRTIALAVSDSQSLLALAYSVNFKPFMPFTPEVCTMTVYHYTIAINYILMSLSAAVMSVLMVQNYWKTPIASVLRTCAHATVFIFMFMIMSNQLARPTFPEWEPTFHRKDSAILLPAACFFDPDLDETLKKTFDGFNATQLNEVGTPYAPRQYSNEFSLLVINLMLYILALSRYAAPRAYQVCQYYINDNFDFGNREFGLYKNISFILFWVVSTIATCVSLIVLARHIWVLRAWADQSGWLQLLPNGTNPESNMSGLAQIAPILALGCIAIAVADLYERERKK
jgi:hypothetical protein